MPDAKESSSSGSEDSDSSDEEVELDEQQLEHLMKIEAELEANPNVYDKHIEYISLLRQAKLRARLRSAYERMAALYPLTEQLWLDWVNDELEQVKSEEDIERIQKVFQLAVKDYLSVNIWSQYIGVVAELDPSVRGQTPEGISKMRGICEAALTSAGLHAVEGGRLWAQYRAFEMDLVERASEKEKQQEKVRSLFHRQLQVPLADNKETMEAYKAWEAQQGKSVPAHVTKAAEKAAEAYSLRVPYEQAVAPGKPADAALLAAYLSYIKLEQAQKDPARVQVVFERALACFPVTAELWAQYTKYLESNLKVGPIVNSVYARATRNCYWVGSLWASSLRALDRFNATKDELRTALHTALTAGMQTVEDYMEVLLAHLDALRHRVAGPTADAAGSNAGGASTSVSGSVSPQELRAGFEEASATMAAFWPTYLDRMLRLPSYHAHCELHVLKDIAAARKVWEDALKSGLGRYYESWLAYANMERGLRNLKEARNVFKRAYSRRLEEGGQPLVCAEWLRFEREEGSAEDLFQASVKVDPVMEEAAAAAAAAADKQAAVAAKAAAKQAPKLSKEEVAQMRRQNDPNFGKAGGKAAAGKGPAAKQAKASAKKADKAGGGAAPAAAGTAKRAREEEQPAAADEEGLPAADAKRAKRGEAAVTGEGAQQQQQQQQQGAGPAEHEMSEAHPQQQAEQAEGGGDAEMGEEGGAPSTAQQQHEFVRFTDDNTVFVRGLPLEVKEADLEEFFKSAGPVKSVRLPKNPATGGPRGIAYVEFHDEQALQQAVTLNGSTLPGSTSQQPLFIAKSAPPGKAPQAGRGRGRGSFGGRGGFSDFGRGRSGGGRGGFGGRSGSGGGRGSSEAGAHLTGRGAPAGHQRQKMQVDEKPVPTASFMPRAVATKAAGPPEAGAKPKSNEDFRKMLLGGKKQ